MAQNARKHEIPNPGDLTVTWETIFETFGNSINDVVPVATTAERAQVVAALAAAGQGPSPTRPLIVARGDAPGLRRVEVTFDGVEFVPLGAGGLRFATREEANSWGTANGGLLSAGDRAVINNLDARWSGTGWDVDGDTATPALGAGWASPPSMNVIEKVGPFAVLTFNAQRTANSAVDAVAVSIPVGFRGSRNVFTHAWGLLGAPASIQCFYDSTAHQVKMRQTLTDGQSIALSMMWRRTG
jgi:hypothetical protein